MESNSTITSELDSIKCHSLKIDKKRRKRKESPQANNTITILLCFSNVLEDRLHVICIISRDNEDDNHKGVKYVCILDLVVSSSLI